MEGKRFNVLDGWRGISILLVLTTHLLPVGPHSWHLNLTTGMMGMALFFSLSGFLVTHFLLKNSSVSDFIIRRFFRIVPLAWLYVICVLSFYQVSASTWTAHLLFYANLPPKPLIQVTDHLWSLCVEMQFYVGIAILVALLKKRGLLLIPLLCAAFTMLRIANGMEASVITYYRIDEVLAGGIIALIYHGKLGAWPVEALKRVYYPAVFALLLISCHPDSGFMNYLRPYLAAILVGATLYNQQTWLAVGLQHRTLLYIASISYALYVIHPLLNATWLGSGDLLEKYSKRPLLFAALFLSAHVSTYYYEHKWIAWGKQLSEKLKAKPQAEAP
ncbi:MAG: acyltransferase [Pseudomonadota bacterium]